MKPDILYEDNDLIVCIKPARIPTQSSRIGTPDLVSILKNHLHTSSVGKPRQPFGSGQKCFCQSANIIWHGFAVPYRVTREI